MHVGGVDFPLQLTDHLLGHRLKIHFLGVQNLLAKVVQIFFEGLEGLDKVEAAPLGELLAQVLACAGLLLKFRATLLSKLGCGLRPDRCRVKYSPSWPVPNSETLNRGFRV